MTRLNSIIAESGLSTAEINLQYFAILQVICSPLRLPHSLIIRQSITLQYFPCYAVPHLHLFSRTLLQSQQVQLSATSGYCSKTSSLHTGNRNIATNVQVQSMCCQNFTVQMESEISSNLPMDWFKTMCSERFLCHHEQKWWGDQFWTRSNPDSQLMSGETGKERWTMRLSLTLFHNFDQGRRICGLFLIGWGCGCTILSLGSQV